MSALLRVIDPGLATTLQDGGRRGHQRFGIPVSGALDRESLAIANALVGSRPLAGALEMRYLGPVLEAVGGPARIALAGAAINARIERRGESEIPGSGTTEHLAAGRSATLRPGDRITVGALGGSSTAYLAVAGGLAFAPVMGSVATYTKGGFGGVDGRALESGDALALAACEPPDGPELTIASGAVPEQQPGPLRIRVVMGPQSDHFTAEALERFLSACWRISRDADRMGLRLEGPALAHCDGFNIASDGIAEGAIQVPGSRQPIVLLADRQTTGGYPKIAVVISADLPRLGRASPGDEIRFQAVSAAGAVAATRRNAARVARLIASIGPLPSGPNLDLRALYESDLISPPVDLD